MGSVGLNFGSATSGQGFDVSSTVNQIVTNLQAVETPWKTQLTGLQSKDTALSSLGTQLASLTSDLQDLTDFTGALTLKTGSSSDTNVVTGSINSSANAVPGTYTIVVQNLAQNSSAATDSVGASDVLTGGITFKIGGSCGSGQHGADSLWIVCGDQQCGCGGHRARIDECRRHATALADKPDRWICRPDHDCNSTNNPTAPTTLADSTTADTNTGLGLATVQNGVDAEISVDNNTVTSASNTVTNAIPGLTLQLLSTGTPTGTGADATPESVQVVVDNDTTSIESAVANFVTDYNATIAAINAQEGKDSSGNPGAPVWKLCSCPDTAGLVFGTEHNFWIGFNQLADLSRHYGRARAMMAPSASTLAHWTRP